MSEEMSNEEGTALVHQLATELGLALVDKVEALPKMPNAFFELPVSARMFSAFLVSAMAGTDLNERLGLLKSSLEGLLLYLEADCLRAEIEYPEIRILVNNG